jgi:L-amino acid N-acyltransferase YncA
MAQFTVRPATAADARAMAEFFAAVAGEHTGIASEPPLDVEERTARFAATIAESIRVPATTRKPRQVRKPNA